MDTKFIRNKFVNLANSKIVMELILSDLNLFLDIFEENCINILFELIFEIQKMVVFICIMFDLFPILAWCFNVAKFIWVKAQWMDDAWTVSEFKSMDVRGHQRDEGSIVLSDFHFFFKPW